MASRFASAKNSIAECDRCGFRFKLTELKKLVIKTKNVNIKVCPECWEPDQPQLQLGLYPVNDPQAVREPRPDVSYYTPGFTINRAGVTVPSGSNGSRVIEWGWNPVGGARNFDSRLTPNALVATSALGVVTAGTGVVPVSFSLLAGGGYDDGGDYAVGLALEDSYYGPFGTATPSSVLGQPVAACYDQQGVSPGVVVSLSGFASAPPSSFFTSVTCNGVTLTSASATFYWEYNGSTVATWIWSATQFGLVAGNTYTVTFA